MSFQRHVIIVGHGVRRRVDHARRRGGPDAGQGRPGASAAGDIWVVYPNTTGPDRLWVYVAWVAISLVGIYVQLQSGGSKAPKRHARK